MAFENAQQMIPKIQAFFANQPIKRAWLFGSYSRGEERPDSDVDILVEYENSDEISLFAISRMMSSLKKILNRKVDLVEEGCVLPFAVDSVYKDRILIYEGDKNNIIRNVRSKYKISHPQVAFIITWRMINRI